MNPVRCARRLVRTATGAVLLGVLVVGSGGCAKQLQRIETKVDALSVRQADLDRAQQETARLLDRIDAREGEREQELVERRAELQVQLEALDRIVRQMDARAQEQEALLRRISAALDILARTAAPPSGGGGSSDAGADTTAASPGADADVPGGSPGTDVFDAAFADYTRGRYGLAREGFEELLRRYPQSELSDDAAYWRAETFYGEGDYAKARDAFAAFVREHDGSELLAAALLKWGYALVETGEIPRAREILTRLVADHPGTDEALIAEHRLSALDRQR